MGKRSQANKQTMPSKLEIDSKLVNYTKMTASLLGSFPPSGGQWISQN